jgi:signal transduction histidine kinase
VTDRLPRPRLVRELERANRANLWSDLVAQVIVGGLVLGTGSVWIGVTWVVRWGVVAGILIADRQLAQGRVNASIHASSIAHSVAAVITVLVIPETGAIAMLILAGDLFIVTVMVGARSPLASWLLCSIGLCTALTFQDFTQVSETISFGLGLFAITSHTFGSGLLVPGGIRSMYELLRSRADELVLSGARLPQATSEERAAIVAALDVGPIRQLRSFHADLDDIEQRLLIDRSTARREIEALADRVRSSLETLRTISHGLRNDDTGLDFALACQRRATSDAADDATKQTNNESVAPTIDIQVLDPTPEARAAVLTLIDFVAESLDQQDHYSIKVAPSHLERGGIAVVADIRSDRGPLRIADHVLDAFTNAGGEARFVDGPTSTLLEVYLPDDIDSSAEPVAPGPTIQVDELSRIVAQGSQLVMDRFVTAGLRISLVAIVASLLVVASTGHTEFLLVSLTLGVLASGIAIGGRLARAQRFAAGVVFLSVTAALVGPALALLVTDLAAPMALVVLVPSLLALPHLSARQQAWVRLGGAVSLTLVSGIAFVDRSVLSDLPPTIVPLLVTPVATVAIGQLMVNTSEGLQRALSEVSLRLRGQARGVVAETARHRSGIERNLHDGAQQQFVAISMRLRMLEMVMDRPKGDTSSVIVSIRDLLRQTEEELFTLGQGALNPDVAAGRLEAALQSVVTTAGTRVSLESKDIERVSRETSAAVYFACCEAIQNAVKHGSPDSAIRVSCLRDDKVLRFKVGDDGPGFALDVSRPNGGLASIVNRIGQVGGEVSILSRPSVGTEVSGWVPVGSV